MSDTKAICEPSGDQFANLSCAPEECVRFRVGPFSIGVLKTSPRATNSARSPFGLKPTDSIRFAADTRLGRRALPSSGTLIEIGVLLRVRASNTCNSPSSSYTIWFSLSELGQRTSQGLLFVTFEVRP